MTGVASVWECGSGGVSGGASGLDPGDRTHLPSAPCGGWCLLCIFFLFCFEVNKFHSSCLCP